MIRNNKQSLKETENHGEPENFKNEIPLAMQRKYKLSKAVQFQDNPQTASGKDYGEPL